MKRHSKSSLATQYIVVFGVLMMLANIALGYLLLRQSSSMMNVLIRKSMLNVSNTAAELIDGDAIGALTAEDVGSTAYQRIYDQLTVFQNNADVQYIYAARQSGDDVFTFTVDPDPVDPGAFGEALVVTDALRSAGRGVAAVDDELATDRWGSHYSAYSPIFDSRGRVAGVIGVDFNSLWYNQQIWSNTLLIILFSLLFTSVGTAAFFWLGGRMRRRFDALNAELAMLSHDVEELTEEFFSGSDYQNSPAVDRQPDEPPEDGDELRTLGGKIHNMHVEMERYLDYMHAQVNTDGLTRVGNTKAYLERQNTLEAKIPSGAADFSVVMFDINDLKHINDRFGHDCGDRIIRAAAACIAESFGAENTCRIGGDEFIAIVEHFSPDALRRALDALDAAIADINSESPDEARLSISRGSAGFDAARDRCFRDVFLRADSLMYADKEAYHHSGATA